MTLEPPTRAGLRLLLLNGYNPSLSLDSCCDSKIKSSQQKYFADTITEKCKSCSEFRYWKMSSVVVRMKRSFFKLIFFNKHKTYPSSSLLQHSFWNTWQILTHLHSLNHPMRKMQLLSLFYRWENCGTEMLSYLPKATQLRRGRARNPGCLTPEPCSSPLLPCCLLACGVWCMKDNLRPRIDCLCISALPLACVVLGRSINCSEHYLETWK